ncbi:7231_t:CDS:2 [Entrophospora sp. SA101]|nr:7231_t:CDS:2 [Entrophospora sp. SA101]
MDSKVDSLFNLCKATIWKSRYFLDGVGSVPYRLIRTILMDFKPEKILEFEEKSPQLAKDDMELWEMFCQKLNEKAYQERKKKKSVDWRKYYFHLLKEQNAKFEKARAKLRASVAATVKEREARSIKMISFIPSKNRNAKKNLTPLQKLRKEMIKTNYNDNNKLKKYSMSVPITWLQREGGFKIYSHDSSSNTFSSAIKSISKSSQKLDLRYKPYPTIPRSNRMISSSSTPSMSKNRRIKKSSISNLKIARATSQPYSINRPSTISPKLKSSSSSPTTTNPSTKFFGSKKAQLSTPPTNSLTKKVVSPVISSKSSSTIKHRVNLKQEKF